ncbi:thiamine pyrophosphate-binding protein [Halobacillus sp. Marseille-Q1614]|uniref:thiamine pyrophosphate-binding protein n=1 Tax=Halobacillus sp. Marseille-Q1614 TaxID=2709134 RepID=UPI00156E18AC|nr:thiamine pyrophosphate-binding protein [Halobacillus sp. Marseille-Q1614]
MKQTEQMSSAQAIIECLKIEGIQKVFCVPGESYLPVMDAIYDEPSIKLISTRHEGGASFMAEGFAKASGQPGVVMATRGVGGSNLAIGVHTAYQDSTPMIVLLGQVDSRFRGREGFQEVDLDRFFAPIAKWTVEIQEAKRVPEIVQRALRIAQTGRPGPVVISLPEDLLKKSAAMEFGKPVDRPSPCPSLREVQGTEKLLLKAKRPLVIAGGGVKNAGAEKTLVQFAEKFSLPVMAAFRRHDVFPNNHSLYAGHLGLGTNPEILKTVKEADAIIAIGTRLSEVTTQDYSLIRNDQTLIHIDIDTNTLGKVYAPDIGIVADAKEGLTALMEMKLPVVFEEWGKAGREAYQALLKPEKEESVNKKIIALLQKHLPKDAILTNDAGNFAGWLHAYYQFNQKNTYIGPTSGAMGYGMPAALGAKLAWPNRTVVSLSGDGGFMMTMQELETAVRYQIPVISIVFNNRMYGTIRMHQEIHFPYKTIGTDLGSVPFYKIAQGFGALGIYVREPEEFEQALLQVLKEGKPAVIEVESDPEQISLTSTIEQLRQNGKNNN